MSDTARHDVTFKRVRYEVAGMRDVPVRHVTCGAQTLTVYHPPHARGALPAVILVSGLSDLGARRIIGCRINEMEAFVSWGQLLAASGLVAITYTTGTDPAADLDAVGDYLEGSALDIGVDAARLGLWATSSHGPNALGALITHPARFRCAVLSNAFMLDLEGVEHVATAQNMFRFVNPAAGRTIDDVPPDVSLLVVRSGRDTTPYLNPSIDAFVMPALRRNLRLTLINHPAGAHCFELEDDGQLSAGVVTAMIRFFQSTLSAR